MSKTHPREHVRRALAGLSREFASARSHLHAALAAIDRVERRKGGKPAAATPAEKWRLDLATGMLSDGKPAPGAVEAVEDMIRQEQEKLEAGKKENEKSVTILG